MGEYLTKNKDLNVASQEEGVARVRQGGYALLMETARLEYVLGQDQDCELEQVGGLLKTVYYGIGLKHGTNFKELMIFEIVFFIFRFLLQSCNQPCDPTASVCWRPADDEGQVVEQE